MAVHVLRSRSLVVYGMTTLGLLNQHLPDNTCNSVFHLQYEAEKMQAKQRRQSELITKITREKQERKIPSFARSAELSRQARKVEDSISRRRRLDNGIRETSSCQATMTTRSIGTCVTSSCCGSENHAVNNTSWF